MQKHAIRIVYNKANSNIPGTFSEKIKYLTFINLLF